MYKDEVFTDVAIQCGNKEFKAHKAVLASQSPVLRKMFEVDMQEKRSNVIKVLDIEPEVMGDLLDYMYTGDAPHLSSLTQELLNASNKYELPRLFALCENELKKKLKVSTVIETLIWADLHSTLGLRAACLQFICAHSAAVKETGGWRQLKDNIEQYSALLIEIMDMLAK